MRERRDTLIFGGLITALLLLQFHRLLSPGHSLYLAIIEDPGARYSWFPWDLLAARQFRAGYFPLWNPFSATGQPLLANFQSAVFFPLKFFYYLFPHYRLLDLMVVVRLALAGTFTFVLARSLGHTRLAAGFAGCAFALSGYFMKFMNVVHVENEMWLPLLLFLLRRERESRRPFLFFLVASWGWALVLLGGNPEAAVYNMLVVVFYCLALGAGRGDFLRGVVRGVAGPLALGGLLAAVQILPFLEYLPHAWHVHDPRLHLVAVSSPHNLWSLIAPWLAGSSGSHLMQLTAPPYVGLITFVLALVGLSRLRRQNRTTLYFLAMIILLLSLAYKLPPLGYLSWLPPFNRSGNVKFALLGVSLFAALLAGAGLDTAVRAGLPRRRTALYIGAGGVFLLLAGFYCRLSLGHLDRTAFLFSFGILLAGSILLIVSTRRRSSPHETPHAPGRPPAAAALALLGVLELFVLFQGFRFRSEILPGQLHWREPVRPAFLEAVMKDPSFPRLLGLEQAFHPSQNILYSLYDLRSFEALYPRAYVELMGEIEGFELSRAVEEFFRSGWMFDVRAENLGHPFLDELGVKYVVSRGRGEKLSAPGFRRIFSAGPEGYDLYLNEEVFPRSWLEGPSARRAAELVLYTPERVEARVTGPGKFVISDTYFPGWKAHLDGREVRLMREQRLFRAVEIGSGEHLLQMTYRPLAFRLGLWMTVVAGLATGVWILGRRNKPRPVDEGGKEEGR